MPRLKMLRGPEPGLEIPLEGDLINIGRGRRNDIIIQDNEVSRMHCRLVKVLEDYEIHDLRSTNGTFVNGQKIDDGGWLLSGRCIVELGDSITFEYIPSDIATGTSVPIPAITDETPPSTYYLVIVQESVQQPEIYVLDRLTITMGRDIDNDIVLREPEISRHHLRLVMGAEGYTVEDLNTLNGTQVNGRPLTQQRLLRSSDRITVGTGLTMWFTDRPDQMVETLHAASDQLHVFSETDTRKTSVATKSSDETAEDRSPFSGLTRRLDQDEAADDADNSSEESESQTATVDDPGMTRMLSDDNAADAPSSDPSPEETGQENSKADETVQAKPKPAPHPTLPVAPEQPTIKTDVGHGLHPNELEQSIFLAYARSEWQDFVGHLYVYLEDNGFQIFAEQYLTPDTQDWEQALEQAQSEAQCLLAIISQESINVPYVQRSIRHFIARERPVLLVQIGHIKRPPIIIQSLPAIQFDRQEPDKTYRMILAELRRVGMK